MPSQAEALARLRSAGSPELRRDLALQLLADSKRRQTVDSCLHSLQAADVQSTLQSQHRAVLREKFLRLHVELKSDQGGVLRESLTRLLVHIEDPGDGDIYQLGLETYIRQPTRDVAQNLRAVALAGMAPLDPQLACAYAARYLTEPDTSQFNGEPAMTAIDVLVASDRRLPLYSFLLRDGLAMARAGLGEVAGKALEALAPDFPVQLYIQLCRQYCRLDQPTASMGIINYICEQRRQELYEELVSLTMGTRHRDLRRYGLVMMAAARDEALSSRLIQLAGVASSADIPLFFDALEICQHPERESTLMQLRRRLG